MKTVLIISICFILASCADNANVNRSYVISKSQLEPSEELGEEN